MPVAVRVNRREIHGGDSQVQTKGPLRRVPILRHFVTHGSSSRLVNGDHRSCWQDAKVSTPHDSDRGAHQHGNREHHSQCDLLFFPARSHGHNDWAANPCRGGPRGRANGRGLPIKEGHAPKHPAQADARQDWGTTGLRNFDCDSQAGGQRGRSASDKGVAPRGARSWVASGRLAIDNGSAWRFPRPEVAVRQTDGARQTALQGERHEQQQRQQERQGRQLRW